MFASRAPQFQAELSTRCHALEYIPTSDELLVSGGDYLELLGRGVGAVQWQDAYGRELESWEHARILKPCR